MSLPTDTEADNTEADSTEFDSTEFDTAAVDAQIAQSAPLLLEYLNEDHGDSVAFLARILGERPGTQRAEAVAIDRLGIDLVVDSGQGGVAVRIEFATPAAGVDELSGHASALLAEARRRSGEPGQTSMERERSELAQVRTFLTRVVGVEDVGPWFRQLTLGGGLEALEVTSPDTFVYLFAPRPPATELTIDETFTWEGLREMAPEDWPVGAYYTVRRWRPDVGEVDLLVVLHEHGEAAGWAAQAKEGDPVALWGPRTGFAPPADTERYLLVADETGLPAVAAILESLPEGTPVQVVAEVPHESARLELRTSPSTEVTWLHRDGADPGTTTLLVDAVRDLSVDGHGLYAWGGGESKAVTAVRRHLRGERGMEQSSVLMVGYWRYSAG